MDAARAPHVVCTALSSGYTQQKAVFKESSDKEQL